MASRIDPPEDPESNMAEQQERRSVAERREQLIDAAISVLASEGIGAATTRRITDEAGLALGAFHYAFRNKDDLLEAVMERLSRSVEEVLERSVLEPSQSLERFGETLARTYWGFVEQTTQMQLAQYELTVHAMRDEGLRPLAQAQYDRMNASLELALDDHPAIADHPQRRDLASYILAVLDGLILRRIVEDDPQAAERRLELFIGTFPVIASQLRGHSSNPTARSA